MRTYTVILTPDTEVGGYTVRVPALPGCNTQGDTLEEALANAREAIELYLEDLRASGEPIPEDTGDQAIRVEVAA
ncbi:MAG: type II toxin-antitoxin system HicB family antitoxin [Chloroflexota bacterium]|nr:MAG: type II toxin-antitoxin system HicB family antitoxin [Chloroflexota bacterium]